MFAVDLRRESLALLWIRAILRGQWNVRVIHGEVNNPDLPARLVDAVLVANTYHESRSREDPPRAPNVDASRRPASLSSIVRRVRQESRARRPQSITKSPPATAAEDIQREGFQPTRTRGPLHRSARGCRRLVAHRVPQA